jgi:hypothetical protein
LSNTKSVEKETRFSLFLFGKPAWEIEDLEGELNFKTLEEIYALGKELNERLQWVARIARELLNHGWDAYGTLYDIDFYKLVPFEVAEKELKELGLDPDKLGLEEEEIDDESDGTSE